MAFSPDGRRLAYTAQTPFGRPVIHVRELDTLESRSLAGTEGATSLFWSPDSRQVAFATGSELNRVDASGGSAPAVICTIDGPVGIGTWSPAGTILFGGRGTGPIRSVRDSGGTAVAATALGTGEGYHSFPVFLPDGRHFLYLSGGAVGASVSERGIFVGSIDRPPEEQPAVRLVTTRYGATYVTASASALSTVGHLVYLNGSTLVAQPFDAATRTLHGDPIELAHDVATAGAGGYFAVSARSLAFRTGGTSVSRTLTWFDRSGKELGVAGEAGAWDQWALSPRGDRVIATRGDGQGDLWLIDLERGSTARLSFHPGQESAPVWSRDGRDVFYRAVGAGEGAAPASRLGNFMLRRRVDGGDPEILLETERPTVPLDVSPDGRTLLYGQLEASSGVTVYALALSGARQPVPVLTASFLQSQATFSPDGRWVVYGSNESGRFEVYVRPFADPAGTDERPSGRWVISTAGGTQPRWNADGREVVYSGLDNRLMAVDVTVSGEGVRAGAPRPLFTLDALGGPTAQVSTTRWAMSGDGRRFLVATSGAAPPLSPITVWHNWQTALEPGTR
jgi:Tol biopolymer transport system component